MDTGQPELGGQPGHGKGGGGGRGMRPLPIQPRYDSVVLRFCEIIFERSFFFYYWTEIG